MKSYNGFSPAQRMAGDQIIKEAIQAGRLPPLKETRCSMCGQDKGIRHYHCEDYSPDRILDDVRPLCWRCHMMLHSRFRHPLSWERYKAEIRAGKVYPPVYRHDFDILEENFID